MRIAAALATVALTGLVTAGLPSSADAHETGFADIHEHRREGNKICMSDHWHYGAGTPKGTRKAAELDAAQAWASFTSFEYGAAWANVSLAAGKSFDCSTGPSGVTCGLSARPCKAAGRKR